MGFRAVFATKSSPPTTNTSSSSSSSKPSSKPPSSSSSSKLPSSSTSSKPSSLSQEQRSSSSLSKQSSSSSSSSSSKPSSSSGSKPASSTSSSSSSSSLNKSSSSSSSKRSSSSSSSSKPSSSSSKPSSSSSKPSSSSSSSSSSKADSSTSSSSSLSSTSSSLSKPSPKPSSILSSLSSSTPDPVKPTLVPKVSQRTETLQKPPPSRTYRSNSTGGRDENTVCRTAKNLLATQEIDPVWKAYTSVKEITGLQVWCDCVPSLANSNKELYGKCVVVGPGDTNSIQVPKKELYSEPNLLLELETLGGTSEKFVCSLKDVFMDNSYCDPLSLTDIGLLPHQTIPCVLSLLMQRYMLGSIYTTVEPLLVAINPFKDLKNTNVDSIEKYRDSPDLFKLPAHVFMTARTVLDNLHSVCKSQSIIVCGESGAGKTEATKQIMRYFGHAQSGLIDSRIQKAVLAANPVLEAFGNAKTIRNNNSSRFGRFMQLQVAKEGGIEYGLIKNFLLEKSRILTQDDDDRSYHIFYQLLRGATPEMKKKLNLLDELSYTFINPKSTIVPNIDDKEEFKSVMASLAQIGFKDEDVMSILSIVSGVLLLGNAKMVGEEAAGIHDAAVIEKESRPTFIKACELLFLDPQRVEHEIMVKTTNAGNNRIEGRWRVGEGDMLKGSLSKAIYDKLFDYIVAKLNANIAPPDRFLVFIGMLDIFGFEVFKNNSLEQLFINITNERLQKNFIGIVFDRETRLYRSEGVSTADLVWTDNKAIIDLMTDRRCSILSVLEDQCLAPGGTDKGFLRACVTSLRNRPEFEEGLRGNRFIVNHTIGSIEYTAESFVLKNKDVLRSEMVEIVQSSTNPITFSLFDGISVEKGKLAKGQLIGSQFISQLEQLMLILNETEPHFIRCVKPNEAKQPLVWDAPMVLVQLHALSILEALQLRNLGYTYRRPFHEFVFQFKFTNLGVFENSNISDMDKCRTVLQQSKIPSNEWQIGKTMVFMKQSAAKAMTALQRTVLAKWEPVVRILEAMYLRKLYRKKRKAVEKPFVRLQCHVRKQLVTKNLVPEQFAHYLMFPVPMLLPPMAYMEAPSSPYPMPSVPCYVMQAVPFMHPLQPNGNPPVVAAVPSGFQAFIPTNINGGGIPVSMIAPVSANHISASTNKKLDAQAGRAEKDAVNGNQDYRIRRREVA